MGEGEYRISNKELRSKKIKKRIHHEGTKFTKNTKKDKKLILAGLSLKIIIGGKKKVNSPPSAEIGFKVR